MTETFQLPAYWASALINLDYTGLDDADEQALDQWIFHNAFGKCAVAVSEETQFLKYHDAIDQGVLACDCLEYTFSWAKGAHSPFFIGATFLIGFPNAMAVVPNAMLWLFQERQPIPTTSLPNQMTVALTSIKQATNELNRLEGIRNNLAGLIVELEESGNPSANTWVSIYSSRLQENVLPALKETREYLNSASLLVPATAGRHQ